MLSKLAAGALVRVEEVLELRPLRCLRARLAGGWITLKKLKSGRRFAVRADVEDGEEAKSGSEARRLHVSSRRTEEIGRRGKVMVAYSIVGCWVCNLEAWATWFYLRAEGADRSACLQSI